jgi:hypothetical protein
MKTHPAHTEATTVRQVFPSWSITIPATFTEDFVESDGYWHARDADRSVSLSSVVITERDRPVRAEAILRQMPPLLEGEAVAELPPGLLGWAVVADAPASAVASRMLSGILVVDGRALIATITSDDLHWARETWLSIRNRRD